jgi:hypothetical protein
MLNDDDTWVLILGIIVVWHVLMFAVAARWAWQGLRASRRKKRHAPRMPFKRD